MTKLKQQIEEFENYLLLKNYSRQTRRTYLSVLRAYDTFRTKNGMMGDHSLLEVKQYLLFRINQGKSWSTINTDYSALRQYFTQVIGIDWSVKMIPRPRKERKLPAILSKEDVRKIIEGALNFKHQVFLTFIYATGLRLSEAVNVKIKDIDGHRNQLRISKGKGAKDRYVNIPQSLISLLRTYYLAYQPRHYLFNGRVQGSRLSLRSAQWSMKRARQVAKVTKSASIHTLRHCYATHHIEAGTDLVYLREQLGHKQLRTTARYVQVCMEKRVRQIHHPIDSLQIHYRQTDR